MLGHWKQEVQNKQVATMICSEKPGHFLKKQTSS